MLLCLVASASALRMPIISRRAALVAAPVAIVTTAPKSADASLALLGLAAKERRREKGECFDAMDCAEAVPAYDITCQRDDSECLQRRQRQAREELKSFRDNPGGAVGVVALLALRPLSNFFRGR